MVTHHGQNMLEKYLRVPTKANACSIAFSAPYNTFSEGNIRCMVLLKLVKETSPSHWPLIGFCQQLAHDV